MQSFPVHILYIHTHHTYMSLSCLHCVQWAFPWNSHMLCCWCVFLAFPPNSTGEGGDPTHASVPPWGDPSGPGCAPPQCHACHPACSTGGQRGLHQAAGGRSVLAPQKTHITTLLHRREVATLGGYTIIARDICTYFTVRRTNTAIILAKDLGQI